jgi:prepilin-type N-terminal cleavage/methylation domain-containing protein
MKKTCSSKKSAFSLIELSIVLIIIGLLIAGITGGASLIKSSELRSAMSEARAFQTSVNGFYTQFGSLPGDFSTVIGTSGAGNNNGHIEYVASVNAAGTTCTNESGTYNCSEGSNAWIQMRNAGTIDSNLVSATTPIDLNDDSAPTFGTDAPSSKIKSAGWAFDYRDIERSSGAFGHEASSQNVVVLTGAIGSGSYNSSGDSAGVVDSNADNNVATAAIVPTDALSIDSKIDDGNAGAGKVRGLNPASSSVQTESGDYEDTAKECYYYSSSTFTYETTNTVKACGLTFQVDVNS